MSVTTRPLSVTVAYQSPHERALSSASRTLISILIAIAIVVLPLVQKFFEAAIYTRAALVGLLSAIGAAVCATLVTYALAYRSAVSTDPVYQAARQARRAAKPQTPDQIIAGFLADYERRNPPLSPPPPGVPEGSGEHP